MFILIALGALVGYFIAFPIYAIHNISELRREVDQLKARLREMTGATPLPQAPPTPKATRQSGSDFIEIDTRPGAAVPLTSPYARPEARTLPRHMTPVTASVAAQAIPQPPPAAPAQPFDWEKLIGANWLAKLGIAAIAVGIAFFLQYAFRNGWIGPGGQVAIGLLVAATMTGIGQYLIRKPDYRTYAQVLSSGGIIVYFLSIYAAYGFYQPRLIGYAPAFTAMSVGALAASLLAMRNNAQVPAILCVLGAFAAPVLLRQTGGPSDPGSLMQLYAYLVLINIWVAGLIRIKSWCSLAVVALASTWLIFFNTGPLQGRGWAVEGFAACFLMAALYTGLQALQTERKPDGALTEVQQVGIGLIAAGCIGFMAASPMALHGLGYFGLPDLVIAAAGLSFVAASVMALLPNMGDHDRAVRQGFGYLAAASLGIMVLIALSDMKTVSVEEMPIAAGFTLFNYLLFQVVAFLMTRRPAGNEPAAALLGANAVVHGMMAYAVLGNRTLLGAPAFALWLPVVGILSLAAAAYALRRDREAIHIPAVLASIAILFPIGSTLTDVDHGRWAASALGLFALEFFALSAGFIVLRRALDWPIFRVRLIAPIALAATFFTLAARCLEMSSSNGVVLLAAVALSMSAYHALVVGLFMRGRDEDMLARLIYLGLAVTFLTIAIPLQVKASYVTLAWTVEAVALLYAGIAARDFRVRVAGMILFLLAAAHAVALDLLTKPSAFLFLVNERMLGGAAVVAAAYVSAWMLWRAGDHLTQDERPVAAGLVGVANLFTLVFMSVDNWDFVGSQVAEGGIVSSRQLALSLFWTTYALIAVIVGMWKRARPVRLFAMGLLYLSILKVFLFDLNGLEQPYKIVSFLALGVILLLISLLYTRFEGVVGGGKVVEEG